MKSDKERLALVRQERDTLRETIQVMEEIQALQERLRAIPVLPYLPMPYPAYPVVPGPVIPWQPLLPPWTVYGTCTTQGTTEVGGVFYQSVAPN